MRAPPPGQVDTRTRTTAVTRDPSKNHRTHVSFSTVFCRDRVGTVKLFVGTVVETVGTIGTTKEGSIFKRFS